MSTDWSFKDDFWFNVTFIYPATAKEVYLLGDFNGWEVSDKYCMLPQEERPGYQLTLSLSEGYYHYKFLVDGVYKRDEGNPHVGGTYNNSIMFVHMDPQVYGIRSNPQLPQRTYNRPNWNGNELLCEWPPIPPHISRFGILERPLFVYLPPSYYSCPEKLFPVVYAHDGQNLFSTTEGLPWGGWYLDEKLDNWWSCGILPEFILVGIPNSDYICIGNRQKDYTATDFLYLESEPYVQYLLQVIKPAIDNKYRTLSGPTDTITLGSSLGGLMSLLLAAALPNIFSCGICLSPALWFTDSQNQSAFKLFQLLKNQNKCSRLYIDSGDGEGDNKELVREMATLLRESDFQESVDFMYHYDECKDKVPFGVTHSESVWRDRVIIGLLFAFNN